MKDYNLMLINFTSSAFEYNTYFMLNKKKQLSNRQYLKIKKYVYKKGLTDKWSSL